MAKSYMCSVCSEKCVSDCIFCETCKTWIHNGCQDIDKAAGKTWEKLPLGYICIRCRCDDAGKLDYLMGTDRLLQAAKGGLKKLKSAAAREKEFVKNVPVHNSVHQDFSKNAEDPVSNFIMSEYSFESKSALFSTGDGDCLFNSVSILLVAASF